MNQDRELRLALICYGGISLAVYMHGIVKEVWHVARASRALHDDAPSEGGVEAVYLDLLREMEAAGGTRPRVLVDVVAGASAGGINGVFLAQAIATGQSLDPLTDMWLERADVEALLAPSQAPSSGFTKAWARPIAWMALSRGNPVEEGVEAPERNEVRAKLDRFVRSRWFEPPFGGETMVAMLLDAFDAMAAGPVGPRLLPPGQPLDLFVTVTDFGGHPEVLRLNSPPEVVETEHRLVFAFHDAGETGAALAHPAELAFAARATSSFPGAFPPFRVGELDKVLAERGREWPGRDAFLTRVLPRQSSVGAAERATLIDGSVLANAPFRPAIDALRERPARRPLDRRFVYIDPAPGHRFGLPGQADEAPGFFQTILGALSELPRKQPIRDNLEAIGHRSERVERMLSVVEALRGEVEAQVESLFGYTLFLDYPTPARLAGWRRRAQVRASARAGFGNAAYGLLKIDSVIDRIAEQLAAIGGDPAPDTRRRIRASIAAVVHARGADSFPTGATGGATPAALDFLRTHDLAFRVRRLRLLARRLAELDVHHPRDTLRPVRDAIYESLGAYLERQRSEPFAHLKPDVAAMGHDAGPLLDQLGTATDLATLDAETDARLSAALSALARDARRPILLAYLGFPFFDLATLPLLHGEHLDEFAPIRVDRIAPEDAASIRSGGADATLKGIQFNNFGAFFSRAYRENDYLWGRLHGAERMIDIIVSTLPATTHLGPGRVTAIKRDAFRAILAEERDRLTAIPALLDSLTREIG